MSRDDLNPVAANGFEQAASAYEQARPSYPEAAMEWIRTLCNNPNTIVDLGAGTGKLTRLLGSFGAQEIIAIEPVFGMRETLQAIPIITQIIDGTAEHIPLADHTVDIVICAQAFHWFANHRALKEIHRVLKSTGVLVLIWNSSDHSGKDWVDQIAEIVSSFKPEEALRYKDMDWKTAFDNQTFFSEVHSKQFSNEQRMTRKLLIQRMLSTSFISALPADRKAKLIAEVETLLDQVEEIRNADEFTVEHRTDVYWCGPLNSSMD